MYLLSLEIQGQVVGTQSLAKLRGRVGELQLLLNPLILIGQKISFG